MIYSTPVLEAIAMPHYIANATRRLMEKVMDQGTGAPARNEYGFKEKAGGKTGTTNDYKDAWFVGYTGRSPAVSGWGWTARKPLPLAAMAGSWRSLSGRTS